MADYTRSQVGRSAAVLTTSEVAGNTLNLLTTSPHESQLTVDVDFTIGSLTNATFRFYASMDGTTFDLIHVGATSSALALTASDTVAVTMPSLAGYKYFRATVQGSGTVTGSSAAFTYRWLRRGSQI
jgi:hypothetical protein